MVKRISKESPRLSDQIYRKSRRMVRLRRKPSGPLKIVAPGGLYNEFYPLSFIVSVSSMKRMVNLVGTSQDSHELRQQL